MLLEIGFTVLYFPDDTWKDFSSLFYSAWAYETSAANYLISALYLLENIEHLRELVTLSLFSEGQSPITQSFPSCLPVDEDFNSHFIFILGIYRDQNQILTTYWILHNRRLFDDPITLRLRRFPIKTPALAWTASPYNPQITHKQNTPCLGSIQSRSSWAYVRRH